MRYQEFVENFTKIVLDYIGEVASPNEYVPGFNIIDWSRNTINFDLVEVSIELDGSEGVYGIGEDFHSGRKAAIRTFELIKRVIEDPVLSKITDVIIDHSSVSDDHFISINFESYRTGRLKIKIITHRNQLEKFSIGKYIEFFEEADGKIKKFEDLILKNYPYTVNDEGFFFERVFDCEGYSKFRKKVEYLIEVKKRARDAGLGVKEIIYIKKPGPDEVLSFELAEFQWKIDGQCLEIYVKVISDYFTEETVNKLLVSEEVTVEDLLKLEFRSEKEAEPEEVNLDVEISNPELLKVLS